MSDDSRTGLTGESTGPTPGPGVSAADERAPNTLMNALLGGVVGVVLSFVPFSTVLGGGVAGYLEGGDARSGAKVGALAGLVAFLPFLFLLGVVFFLVPLFGTGPFGSGPAIALWAFLLFGLSFVAVYVVGLSILGGVLGVYVNQEF